MNPPTGGWTGSGNQEIARQLGNWSVAKGLGRVFDSSTGFRLPDGSTLSPDGSYVSEERLHSLPKGALRGFPRICPDFVIELRSETDALQDLKNKMNDWISNGAQLGWLIDPYERQVLICHTDQATEVVTGNNVAGSGTATKTECILHLSGFDRNVARWSSRRGILNLQRKHSNLSFPRSPHDERADESRLPLIYSCCGAGTRKIWCTVSRIQMCNRSLSKRGCQTIEYRIWGISFGAFSL